MSYAIWTVLYYILGTMYLVDWIIAQGKCEKKDKWLLFTPFWFFYPKLFGDKGKAICRRVQIYFALAGIRSMGSDSIDRQ